LTLLGQAPPLFGSPTLYDTGGRTSSPTAVVTGDLRGNGITDLVVLDQSFAPAPNDSHVLVFFGNGDGTFQSPLSFDAGIGATGLALAALRGTGKPDIIVTDSFGPGFSTGGVDVLLNDGTGTHFNPTFYAIGGMVAVAVGDLRGNGTRDIVTTSF